MDYTYTFRLVIKEKSLYFLNLLPKEIISLSLELNAKVQTSNDIVK